MSLDASDRGLRKLVVDLAEMAPDDVETILDDLDPAARSRVKALVDAYVGSAERPTPTSAPQTQPARIKGFSPWMEDRLYGGPTPSGFSLLGVMGRSPKPAPQVTRSMTPAANALLREALAETDFSHLQPAPPAASNGVFTRLSMTRARAAALFGGGRK